MASACGSSGDGPEEMASTSSRQSTQTSLSCTSTPVQEDNKILVKHWGYPNGKSIPAIVISMNHFVKCDRVYIPCELALGSFTIEKGITDLYWTLVDPEKIPSGYYISAIENGEYFGVPAPPFEKLFQNYTRIVKEIDEYIKMNTSWETPDETTEPMIFCRKKHLRETKAGMQWLYKQIDKEFPYKIHEFEDLLVVLTLGGLQNISEETPGDWGFKDVVQAFDTVSSQNSSLCSVASSVSDVMRSFGVKPKRESMSVSVCSSLFSELSTGSLNQRSVSTATIGRHNQSRVSSMKMDKYPYANLGGCIFKHQAEEYLAQTEFLHIEKLACEFHREIKLIRGQERKRHVKGPKERLVHCALSKVTNQIYLALDAVIVNYGITGTKWKHYPPTTPTTSQK